MVKKKQPYESPEIQVTRVELESSICNGSVDFKEDPGVKISSQEMVTPGMDSDGKTLNDFTEDSWVTPGNN